MHVIFIIYQNYCRKTSIDRLEGIIDGQRVQLITLLFSFLVFKDIIRN